MGDYKVLGVAEGADLRVIKRAYKKLALQHHPDKGGDPERFRQLAAASVGA